MSGMIFRVVFALLILEMVDEAHCLTDGGQWIRATLILSKIRSKKSQKDKVTRETAPEKTLKLMMKMMKMKKDMMKGQKFFI